MLLLGVKKSRAGRLGAVVAGRGTGASGGGSVGDGDLAGVGDVGAGDRAAGVCRENCGGHRRLDVGHELVGGEGGAVGEGDVEDVAVDVFGVDALYGQVDDGGCVAAVGSGHDGHGFSDQGVLASG